MSEENNYEEAGRKDLENRENEGGLFEQEAKKQAEKEEVHFEAEVKPTTLGKSSDWQKKNESDGSEFKMGWHNIPVSQFPSAGLFYPEGTKVSIRAATVKEIRQFSVVNDEDPYSIDDAMNHIMSTCINFNVPGKISNWKDALEEDRIHMVLAVKELTFAKGENRLEIPFECDDCGTPGKMEFCNNNLHPGKIKDDIMKYFDHEERIFKVQTKSSGVLELRPPTIGVMKVITEYIKENTQTEAARKRIDQGFVKCLPFMVGEWRGFKKEKIKEIQMEFMSWNATKFSTFFQVVDMIRVGVDANVHDTCTSCGAEVQAPIMFPGGIKSLFVVSDIAQELL